MSQLRRGKKSAVTPARAVVLELLHHARKASSLPLAKTMNLQAILQPRKTAGVSWTALFLKAYGLTALEHPELRRAFIPYPRKHFYEHPDSVAAIFCRSGEYFSAGDHCNFLPVRRKCKIPDLAGESDAFGHRRSRCTTQGDRQLLRFPGVGVHFPDVKVSFERDLFSVI